MPTPEERLREKERMERIAEKKRKRLEPDPEPVIDIAQVFDTPIPPEPEIAVDIKEPKVPRSVAFRELFYNTRNRK